MINNFFRFQAVVFKPTVHILFSIFWYFALKACLLLVNGADNHSLFAFYDVVAVSTIYLVLLFLRVADEIKDYEYDKEHNPERPLVQGFVTVKDLYVYMVIIAVITMVLNGLAYAVIPCSILVLDFVYGYALIKIEKVFPKPTSNMFVNLIITYPVNVLLSVYSFFLICYHELIEATWVLAMPILAFALGFLYYEFARKTKWPHMASLTEKLYSRSIGGVNAALLLLAVGTMAPVVILLALNPRLEYYYAIVFLCWVPAFLGVVKFLKNRQQQGSIKTGFVYISVFYLSILLVYVVDNVI